MILYRPVGLQELELIYDSGMKAFPARLPQQPIFCPVLQLQLARQTASAAREHPQLTSPGDGSGQCRADCAGYRDQEKLITIYRNR